MFKLKIGLILLFFIANVPTGLFSQSSKTDKSADKYFGSRYSNEEVWAAVGSFENDQIKGSFYSGHVAFRQSHKPNGKMLGIEGGYLNYSFTNLDPAIQEGSGKGNGGSLGFTFQTIRSNSHKLSKVDFTLGGMTENSINNFYYQGKKYIQSQTHWLGYIGLQLDVNKNKNYFNRWVLGTRYEYPFSSKGTATINGFQDENFTSLNKKNFKAWIEPTIFSFGAVPSSGWAVTVAAHFGYDHLSQGVTDLYGIGGILSLYNQYSEVIRIGGVQQFNSKQSSNPQLNLYLAVDVLNIVKPIFSY